MINMVLSYKECLEKYGSDYLINKALKSSELFKIEKGLYSNSPLKSELEVIAYKYPNAILTLQSAFYYHNLIDIIPDKYCLITDKDDTKIKDSRVNQLFENYNILYIGVISKNIEGADVLIYNKERLLLELIRHKNKMPYDYYKKIVNKYRTLINDLDMRKIQDYLLIIPKSKMIKETLEREIL